MVCGSKKRLPATTATRSRLRFAVILPAAWGRMAQSGIHRGWLTLPLGLVTKIVPQLSWCPGGFTLGSFVPRPNFPAMPAILYTVRASCPTIQVRGRFLAWLSPSHLLQVKAGGAVATRVVLPDRASDTAPAVVETQYVFPSRKSFETYVRDHAPALRADSVKHFPPESGVNFERQVAEIAIEL